MKWAKTRSGCSARRSDYITPSAVNSRQSERLSRQRIGGRGGPICFIPSSLKDEHAKDQFANLARLICVAHAATAAVMIMEAWMKTASPDDTLDLTVPLS